MKGCKTYLAMGTGKTETVVGCDDEKTYRNGVSI
jgi:hypothetical protein